MQEIKLLNKNLGTALEDMKDTSLTFANHSQSNIENIQTRLQKQEDNIDAFQKKISSQLGEMIKILHNLKNPARD